MIPLGGFSAGDRLPKIMINDLVSLEIWPLDKERLHKGLTIPSC